MRKEYMQSIWSRCPLCDRFLEGGLHSSHCPEGHYEWNSRGSYAADTRIIQDGATEHFDLDDMSSDWEKFEARVDELRQKKSSV